MKPPTRPHLPAGMLDGKDVPHGILSTEKTPYKSYYTEDSYDQIPATACVGSEAEAIRRHPDPANGEHQEEAAAEFIREVPKMAEPTGLAAIVIE